MFTLFSRTVVTVDRPNLYLGCVHIIKRNLCKSRCLFLTSKLFTKDMVPSSILAAQHRRLKLLANNPYVPRSQCILKREAFKGHTYLQTFYAFTIIFSEQNVLRALVQINL